MKRLNRMVKFSTTSILIVTIVLVATISAVAAGTDVIANGSFVSDTTGWTFVKVAGNPTGSWDSAGYLNGGCAKISSEVGRNKAGQGYWEQTISTTIQANSTVTLSYAWKKGYVAVTPTKKDIYVTIVKPSGATADLDSQLGAPPAYNTWYTISNKDVSSSFNETGTYKIRLRFVYKTGNNAKAQALAWFDEAMLVVTPPQQPTIGLSPTSLTFNAVQGGTNPPSQTVTVSNTGPAGSTLNWSAMDNATWLSESPTSGSLASGNSQPMTVSVDITGLVAGTYNATITVSDPNATNNPQTVSVTLVVAPSNLGSWVEKADTPDVGGYGESVCGDGSYVYIAKCLYATSTPQFWRYTPGTNTWGNLSVTGLPTGAFRNGTAIAWDNGSYVYALCGARYEDADRRLFYHYTISTDSWTQLANTPGPQGAGDAITWSGYDGYVYTIIGSSAHGTVFARYNAANNTWETRASPPAGTDDGCSLVWTGGTYLYALRGEYLETTPLRDFWRYDIINDNWATMAEIPEAGGVGDGGSMIWAGNWLSAQVGYIYALGGGSCWEDPGDNFYRYVISTNTWEKLASIPYAITDYNAGRLGFAAGHIYYWQGMNASYPGGGKKFCMYEFPA